MSQLNYKFISYIIGLLLLFNATAIFLTSFVSYYFNDGFFSSVLKSGLICFIFGLFVMFLSKNPKKIINRRDGYLVVVVGWLTMVFSGMLPYVFTNTIDNVPDLIFETMSGYTTTG